MPENPLENEYREYLELLSRRAQSEAGALETLKLRPDLTESQALESFDILSEAAGLLAERGAPPLSGHLDLAPLWERRSAAGTIIPAEELLLVKEEALCAEGVKKYARGLEEARPLLHRLLKDLGDYREFARLMDQSVAPDGEILDGASAELGRIRRERNALRKDLTDKLRALMRSAEYRQDVQDEVVTTRRERFVIPVRASAAGKNGALAHDWSKTGATAYVEPKETVEDNNRLNYLKVKETREIERILLNLSETSRRAAGDLSRDGAVLSRLDRIFACALTAEECGCSRPDLEKGGGLRLTGLRHPLLERRFKEAGKRTTPLDLILRPEEPMLVISGLNAGGKTVALKALGLNALIAKTGLFVHAKAGSAMELPDEVLPLMGDGQDPGEGLSTFSGHVKRLNEILSRARKGVLILIDELGNGTDPQEGAALALAVLGRLLKSGAFTVTATHFHLVKTWAALTPGAAAAAVNTAADGAPAFGLSYGAPGFSGGLDMAARLGLPSAIVEEARGYLDDGYRQANELLKRLDRELSSLKRGREALEAERLEFKREEERRRDERLKEIEALNREKRKSDLEIRQALNRYRREFEALKAEFRESLREGGKADPIRMSLKKARLDRELEELRPREIPSGERAPLKEDPTPGDLVFIGKLGRTGVVLSWNDEKREGVVESENIRVKAVLGELSSPHPREKKTISGVSNVIAVTGEGGDSALKLLGLTVDEALGEIDKAIDGAVLRGRNRLTVIHGLGTGRLKSGILAYLRKHPRVREFGSPKDAPGGSGVTEVVLDV